MKRKNNMDSIHHLCQCTGKTFTFDEWKDYRKTHTGNEIVKTANGFGYTIYDVCQNPHEFSIDFKHYKKYCDITIETAQSEKKWDYGILLDTLYDGFAKPCGWIGKRQGFNSENKAILAALYFAEKYLKKMISSGHCGSYKTAYSSCLREVQELKEDYAIKRKNKLTKKKQ